MTDVTEQASLRIAVAGGPEGTVEQHFGQAESFSIFDVAETSPRLVEQRSISSNARDGEDRRETIARMLGDCDALLVSRIGPVPQEKMAKAGVDATAAYADQAIGEALAAYCKSRRTPAEQTDETELSPDSSRFRILHTMRGVTDMERSVDFYTRLLGMRVQAQREHRKNQFTQTYLGYGEACDGNGPALELVFNWARETPYEAGESFGHIAIAVNGIAKLCRRLEAEGVVMPRPPRSQRHGEAVVAFIEDPDGHRIELVEHPLADPA